MCGNANSTSGKSNIGVDCHLEIFLKLFVYYNFFQILCDTGTLIWTMSIQKIKFFVFVVQFSQNCSSKYLGVLRDTQAN